MGNVLECANLTKMYEKKDALNGLNLTVPLRI